MVSLLNVPYLFTYLLTYSMEQSPSWKANRFSASREILRISWNPKVHYRIHKCPPPVPILKQLLYVPPAPKFKASAFDVQNECVGFTSFLNRQQLFMGARLYAVWSDRCLPVLQRKHGNCLPSYMVTLWNIIHSEHRKILRSETTFVSLKRINSLAVVM